MIDWKELNDIDIPQMEDKKYIQLRESMLLEMARVGFFDKFEIYVHTDDPGNIPHLHIWDRGTRGQKFHTCISILEPEYFHHTGKERVLNTKQLKAMLIFLLKPSEDFEGSNWNTLIRLWNMNNSTRKVPIDYPMPDYRLLND